MGQPMPIDLQGVVGYTNKAYYIMNTREMLHEEVELPETLGREVALQLLEEVQKGMYCMYMM